MSESRRLFDFSKLKITRSYFSTFQLFEIHKDTFSVFDFLLFDFSFFDFSKLILQSILHTFCLEPCGTSFLPSPHMVGWMIASFKLRFSIFLVPEKQDQREKHSHFDFKQSPSKANSFGLPVSACIPNFHRFPGDTCDSPRLESKKVEPPTIPENLRAPLLRGFGYTQERSLNTSFVETSGSWG